jgi:hypothetical protein
VYGVAIHWDLSRCQRSSVGTVPFSKEAHKEAGHMEVVSVFLSAVAVVVAILAATTDVFKRKVSIGFGFLHNDQIKDKIEVSTGDPAKKLVFRFQNNSEFVLSGIIIDMRFMNPIALSGTASAVSQLVGNRGATYHHRVPDQSYYLINHSAVVLLGEEHFDYPMEINTHEKAPGEYSIEIRIFSTKGDRKSLNRRLSLILR